VSLIYRHCRMPFLSSFVIIYIFTIHFYTGVEYNIFLFSVTFSLSQLFLSGSGNVSIIFHILLISQVPTNHLYFVRNYSQRWKLKCFFCAKTDDRRKNIILKKTHTILKPIWQYIHCSTQNLKWEKYSFFLPDQKYEKYLSFYR